MIAIVPKFSKSVREDQAVLARLDKPIRIAAACAQHLQERLHRGRTATPARKYKTTATAGPKKRRRFYISTAYAQAAGVGDKTSWKSSAEFHAAIGGKPGIATGEMIDGIQVRNKGTRSALIDFGRSSIGARSERTARTRVAHDAEGNKIFQVFTDRKGKRKARVKRDLARGKEGNVLRRTKPTKIKNAEKAGRAFKYLRVAMLQMTPSEQAAMLDAVATETAKSAGVLFAMQPAVAFNDGDLVLRYRILKRLGVGL